MRSIQPWKRALSLGTALLLSTNGMAFAESEDAAMSKQPVPVQDEHFVPENPDMNAADVKRFTLDLTDRKESPIPGMAVDTEEGLLLSGGKNNKCTIPLPFQLIRGQKVTAIVSGRFIGDADRGLRIFLSDEGMDNCSNTTMGEIANDDSGTFCIREELLASKTATALMLSLPSFSAKFQNIMIDSIELEVQSDVLTSIDPSIPYAEAVKQDWYQDMLTDAQMQLGNNKRLKSIIARAQAGERITVATIGGSITEGAGALKYQDCYAHRIYDGVKTLYGLPDGSNVGFVNAGVGGTPSTFGWMRYQRDIVDRVNDDDGLPDIVIIEYSVNDGGEPTNHRCLESMVKQILMQPNEPAVILLFAVFPTGYNLQSEIRKIGETYDLMMVSIKDGPFRQVGSKWTEAGFFFDQYHPTTLGHAVMADCVLAAIEQSLAQDEAAEDVALDIMPAYGVDFMGLQTIYKHGDPAPIALEVGSFVSDDMGSYTNLPIGRVCGENFFHSKNAGNEPLTFTASFRNLMIAYRTMSDLSYGRADVYIDGRKVRTLQANTGSWGQSVVDLLYDADGTAEHTVSICMADGDEEKQFTITCMGYTP